MKWIMLNFAEKPKMIITVLVVISTLLMIIVKDWWSFS